MCSICVASRSTRIQPHSRYSVPSRATQQHVPSRVCSNVTDAIFVGRRGAGIPKKSAEAAQSTTALIESAIKAIENGTKIADETANSLVEVVEMVNSVSSKIDEIATASEEQATAVTQLKGGIEQISAVVQTNSATSEESASASEELSGQAQMLKQVVGAFKLKNVENSASKSLGYTAVEEYEPAESFEFDNDKY